MIRESGWTTPDLYVPGLLLIAIVVGRGRRFVRDWLPFLVLLLAYESLRGAVGSLNDRVHWTILAHLDSVLGFGQPVTERLQALLYRPGADPLNLAVSLIYVLHFVVPLAVAFVLWWTDSRAYWRFASALLLVSFAGFVFFLVFPAAPPWMASADGYIAPVHRVVTETLSTIVHPGLVAYAWSRVGSNPVAPFPSLHAAWPTLVALTLWSRSRSRWRWLLFLYPAFVGFAVVYAAEHYLVDVLAGYAFAVAAFAIVEWVVQRGQARARRTATARLIETGGEPVLRFGAVGVWRSLVARLNGVQEVPGSNPGTPTRASASGTRR